MTYLLRLIPDANREQWWVKDMFDDGSGYPVIGFTPVRSRALRFDDRKTALRWMEESRMAGNLLPQSEKD